MKILKEKQLLLEKRFPKEFYSYDLLYLLTGFEDINLEHTDFITMPLEDVTNCIHNTNTSDKNFIIYFTMSEISDFGEIMYIYVWTRLNNEDSYYVRNAYEWEGVSDKYWLRLSQNKKICGYRIESTSNRKQIQMQRQDNRQGMVSRFPKDEYYKFDNLDKSGYIVDTKKYKDLLYNLYGYTKYTAIISDFIKFYEKITDIYYDNVAHRRKIYSFTDNGRLISNTIKPYGESLFKIITDSNKLLFNISQAMEVKTYSFADWFKSNNIAKQMAALKEKFTEVEREYNNENN